MINKISFYLVCKMIDSFGKAILPGWCNICSRLTLFTAKDKNLRESLICIHCKSYNRKRLLYYFLNKSIKERGDRIKNLTIWNTENSGSLHEHLKRTYGNNYTSSEYYGETVKSGEIINGVRNEDMRNTSFPSNYFDFVISSDDLEHFPDPEKSFIEIKRVLKPGGQFIFTVPFIENMKENDIRARLLPDGSIKYIKEPQYHGDPVRPDSGILVFTIFGEEIIDMFKKSGLELKKCKYASLLKGIINLRPIVFVAEKKLERKEGGMDYKVRVGKDSSIKSNVPDKLKPLIGEFAWHSSTVDPTIESVSQRHYESIVDSLKKYKKDTPLSKLKILEIASYAHITGYMLARQKSDVTLFDISASTLLLGQDIAKKRGLTDSLQLVAGDFHSLPFNNDGFDLIFIASALHHTWEWQKVFKEMLRVLKPSGILIMENEPCKREACFYKFRTNRKNNFTDFEKKLDELGVLTTFAEPYVGSRPESLFGMIENQNIPINDLLKIAKYYSNIKELEVGIETNMGKMERYLVSNRILERRELQKLIRDILKKLRDETAQYMTEKDTGNGFTLPTDQEIDILSEKISTLIKETPHNREEERIHLANIFGAPIKMVLEKKTDRNLFPSCSRKTQKITSSNGVKYAFEPDLSKILIENTSLIVSVQKDSEQEISKFFPKEHWKCYNQENGIRSLILGKEEGVINITGTPNKILVIIRFFVAESKIEEYSVEIRQNNRVLFEFQVWQNDSFIFSSIINGGDGNLTIARKSTNNHSENLISISFIAAFKL